jgi:hypothetical protein
LFFQTGFAFSLSLRSHYIIWAPTIATNYRKMNKGKRADKYEDRQKRVREAFSLFEMEGVINVG